MTHLKFVVKHIYKVQSCIKIGVSRMSALFETYLLSLILNDSEEMTKRFLVVILYSAASSKISYIWYQNWKNSSSLHHVHSYANAFS